MMSILFPNKPPWPSFFYLTSPSVRARQSRTSIRHLIMLPQISFPHTHTSHWNWTFITWLYLTVMTHEHFEFNKKSIAVITGLEHVVPDLMSLSVKSFELRLCQVILYNYDKANLKCLKNATVSGNYYLKDYLYFWCQWMSFTVQFYPRPWCSEKTKSELGLFS